MSDPNVPESEIKVIKQAVLGFVDKMQGQKRMVEQQIRDKSENVRSSVLGTGASQFSYQDVDNLSRKYKDEFLSFYRNTIHLKIISNASSQIKQAIQEGLINANVVQQEWLEGFEALQNQINQYQQIADKAEALEHELEGQSAVAGDVQELQQRLAEKDQLLAEKDQQIENLNEGLARMENQVNALGQNMLENSMTIEELQEAINERDIKIHSLKQQLSDSAGSSAEMELLQQQLQEAKDRERELQSQASSASSDLMTQLQDNLEETREQVLKLRRDLVQKNEELHALRLDQDEHDIKTKQLREQISTLKKEKAVVSQEKETLDEKLSGLTKDKEEMREKLASTEAELKSVSSELETTSKSLDELQVKLKGYEGKVAMSAEEQSRINSELETLRDQLSIYQETIQYLKTTLGEDVKFKVLTIMTTMSDKVRIDDISESTAIPEKVVQRAVLELANQGILEAWKEGRFQYCSMVNQLKVPTPLSSEA